MCCENFVNLIILRCMVHIRLNTASEALYNIVDECFLYARRNVACVTFMQKLISGKIFCPSILQNIQFICPRVNCRTPTTFYYQVPSTFHHFNSPLMRCLRLCNCLINHNVDIFYDNFSNTKYKAKLTAICYNFNTI